MLKEITSIITICYYGLYTIPIAITVIKTTAYCTYYTYYGIKKCMEYKLLKN
jgi:hypothetical protein